VPPEYRVERHVSRVLPSPSLSHTTVGTERRCATQLNAPRTSSSVPATSHGSSGRKKRWIWETQPSGFCATPFYSPYVHRPTFYPALTPPPEQALRHFVISPSTGINPTSNASTKGGYAKQCGVKHVTIESIAYAATMVLPHHLPLVVVNVTPRFATG